MNKKEMNWTGRFPRGNASSWVDFRSSQKCWIFPGFFYRKTIQSLIIAGFFSYIKFV